ncbi:putative cytochrome P450 [Stipitochalara longipes BDJ]|nr:putative cytochrome P450 [Stipitochalara longipes BDJ]
MLLSSEFWTAALYFSTYALIALLLISFLKIAKFALSSPLNTVPGPYINRWTDIPLVIAIFRHRKLQYVHYLHQKYGPYVRTAPKEISISEIASVKAIHNVRNGFEKSDFYENLQLVNTLVCLTDNKVHAARRRHFAGAFSRQNLSEWEGSILASVKKAVNGIRERGRDGTEVDLLSAFNGMAEEVIGELCFGEAFKSESTEQTSSLEKDPKRQAIIKSIRTELLVPGSEFERSLPVYLKYLPRPILSWALAQNKERVGLSDETIVMEAKAFIIAGTDTTAITSSYLIWAVLKHPEVKARLLKEVQSLPKSFSISDVQKLQYVQMVVNESLRLYGAVSSSLPRVAPVGGRKMGNHFIPEGITVTTQSFTLHRNPEVFQNPLDFIPERWENPTPEMKEAFMPFGSGARACIGPHLAQIELALAATLFFRECLHAQVALSMRDDDMEPSDLFVVGPRGQKCTVITS